ncbi:hypothetical protein V500_11247 [Pseudogymnoascus sp. VKM F-4518 (FW-2643)]|nr:hypothetical protein V500_11247 [Pseudogymnoascus sp. VKM F-4518 (FW-2643)]
MAHRRGEHPHDADDVDDESPNLRPKLHLQDAELCGSSAKGKGRNGEFTGESHASQLQKQERGNADLSFSNTGVAQSFTGAVQSHVPTFTNTTSQANIAARDRDLAQGFKGNADLPDIDYTNTNLGSQQLSKLEDLVISSSNKGDLNNGDNGQAESSPWAAGRSANLTSTTSHCDACCNNKSTGDVGCAPCGHEYCRDCLQNLVETAITDESFFPPRCCHQPIPFEAIHKFLTSELAQAFINKKAEFDTQDRTYCSVQTCSAFIGSGNIADNVGTCQECNATTCVLCKAAAHDRGECPNDPTLQQVLDMNCIMAATISPVVVALNFAMSAGWNGRPAPVRNGTNINFSIMQTINLLIMQT